MMMKQFFLFGVAAFSLVACGSGEKTAQTSSAILAMPGSSLLTVASAVTRSIDTSLQTNVPKATYANNSQDLAAFNYLNQRRANCGFGLLKQDVRLDAAALAHAKYVSVQSTAAISHTESKVVSAEFFSGVSPLDRAMAQGYLPSLPYVDEDFGTGYVAEANYGETFTNDLLNAPFHLVSMLRGNRDVGIGIYSADRGPNSLPLRSVVFNMSTVTSVQEPVGVQTFPCQGSTVSGVFYGGESPEPFPGRNYAANPMGSPIAVISKSSSRLVLSSYSLRVVGDSRELALNVLSSLNRSLNIRNNETVLVPELPLMPSTSYEVNLVGTLDGVEWKKVFSFSTHN
jgi:uncharacterized protein YkwD